MRVLATGDHEGSLMPRHAQSAVWFSQCLFYRLAEREDLSDLGCDLRINLRTGCIDSTCPYVMMLNFA